MTIFPQPERYRARTEREIPVVILEFGVAAATPAPIEAAGDVEGDRTVQVASDIGDCPVMTRPLAN